MNIPPQDADRLADACEAAYHTTTGERLRSATVTGISRRAG